MAPPFLVAELLLSIELLIYAIAEPSEYITEPSVDFAFMILTLLIWSLFLSPRIKPEYEILSASFQ